MRWNELYTSDQMPSIEQIRTYIGQAKTNWDELVNFLETSYQPEQHLDFSKDSLQPGWNVKYRKGGKALCTLYPREDYFAVLVVVGAKEEEAVNRDMEAGLFSDTVRNEYKKAAHSVLGRWLMIEVRNSADLKDIQRLINIRVKPKTQKVNHEDTQ